MDNISSLTISKLNKSIRKKTILSDISLNCDCGKIYGLIGPNGCGKSSLFKIISGLWEPTSGNISIDGLCFQKHKKDLLPRIGSFIEMPNIYNDLSGKDNLDILMKLYKIKDKYWYEFLIKEFDIETFMHKKIKTYSLGMKQKIGLIMTLINNPDIILLDEPTNSLDITTVNKLHTIVRMLKENNKIIILSSHILEEVDSLVDEVFIMKSGSILDTYTSNSDDYVYITLDKKINVEYLSKKLKDLYFKPIDEFMIKVNGNNVNNILKAISQTNYIIKSVSSSGNLKDKFIELMEE